MQHRAPAQGLIYPLDTIRTRLAVSPTGMYRGIYHTAQQIIKYEGYRAFYRGIVPSMVGTLCSA